jgi:hypothetical protein
MDFECILVALIYIERLPRLTQQRFRLCPENWQLTVMNCLMISSKVWDDFSMSNFDFASIFDDITLKKINDCELALLHIFNFSIAVTAEEYHHYELTMRSFTLGAIPRLPIYETRWEENKSAHQVCVTADVDLGAEYLGSSPACSLSISQPTCTDISYGDNDYNSAQVLIAMPVWRTVSTFSIESAKEKFHWSSWWERTTALIRSSLSLGSAKVHMSPDLTPTLSTKYEEYNAQSPMLTSASACGPL